MIRGGRVRKSAGDLRTERILRTAKTATTGRKGRKGRTSKRTLGYKPKIENFTFADFALQFLRSFGCQPGVEEEGFYQTGFNFSK